MSASRVMFTSDSTESLESSTLGHSVDGPTISNEDISNNPLFTGALKAGNSSLPFDDLARDINLVVWRVVPPLLLLFGTVGNVMTVVVMRGMRASPSTACLSVYFTALAMSDQCQLLSSQVFYWVDKGFSWPSSFFQFNLLCSVPKFMWCWGGIMSSWCLVAMTYQRVISVIAPHRVGVLCTVRRGKVLVGVIVFVGFAFNVHFLFTWVHWPQHSKCHFRAQYWHLLEYFEWQDMLCFSMLPSLLLIVGNSVLIRQVVKASQLSRTLRRVDKQSSSESGKVHSMSVTLIVTSMTYLLLTLPACVFEVALQITYIETSDGATELIWTAVMLGWMIAAGSNFYLYLLSGRKFRNETKRYLSCCNTVKAR